MKYVVKVCVYIYKVMLIRSFLPLGVGFRYFFSMSRFFRYSFSLKVQYSQLLFSSSSSSGCRFLLIILFVRDAIESSASSMKTLSFLFSFALTLSLFLLSFLFVFFSFFLSYSYIYMCKSNFILKHTSTRIYSCNQKYFYKNSQPQFP